MNMANNSSILSIEDLISIIYSDIESKKKIISSLKTEYKQPSSVNGNNTISINAFAFFDLIDEFDITISQSLQAIQTLQTEMWNLKEKIEMNECNKQNNEYCNKRHDEFNIIDDAMEEMTRNDIEWNDEPEVESIRKDLISHKYTNEETKEYKTIRDDILQISSNRTRTPIRQSLRQTIKAFNNSQLEIREDKIRRLIDKIGGIESYRKFFARKYGKGSYDIFLHKLNNKAIIRQTIEDELSIIEDIMMKKNNNWKNEKKKSSYNNINNANTGYCNDNISIKKVIGNSTSSKRYDSKQKLITLPTNNQKRKAEYVQPIDFSENSYLRNSKTNKLKRSLSKENKMERR